jgi:hypothetical protein
MEKLGGTNGDRSVRRLKLVEIRKLGIRETGVIVAITIHKI